MYVYIKYTTRVLPMTEAGKGAHIRVEGQEEKTKKTVNK